MHELKKAIEEASSVLIAIPGEASDRDYLVALQLQKIAPQKIHVAAPSEKELLWQDVFGSSPVKKEFAIVIDTERSPVEELRYEKDDGKLTIFLSHKHPFRQEALHFEEHLPAADLIVTLGFRSREAAEQFTESFPRKGAARHIWIGGNGTEEKISPGSAGLLGRLLARSREDTELGVLWSFITKEDFLKTKSGENEIPPLINAFAKIVSLPRGVVVFWQAPGTENTNGLCWSEHQALLTQIAAHLGATQSQGERYISLPRFSNFIEAESAIRKLLRTLP